MPELPEVETTRQGLEPHLIGRHIACVDIRTDKLRHPLDKAALQSLIARRLSAFRRRGKYLIIDSDRADSSLLIHLGMSGSLRISPLTAPPKAHDHILITLDNASQLRFHDPRKFGSFMRIDPRRPHPLLSHLGPEPLSEAFNGDYLYRSSRKRSTAIKTHLMNQDTVVGVGNIYASEALFLAGIRPDRRAGSLSPDEAQRLAEYVKAELRRAITLGGTTLRDFVHPDGSNGYFQQSLQVYGRAQQPCLRCATPIQSLRIGQRNSFFCPQCQQ